MIKEIALIIVSVVFVNNFVLSKFLGLCPFLGVSQKTSSALGMGVAVTFVMTIASAITWIVYNYILLPGNANIVAMVFPSIRESGLIEVLKTISYILVIATLVQLVEMMLRKMMPALYESLGIYPDLACDLDRSVASGFEDFLGGRAVDELLQATVQGF